MSGADALTIGSWWRLGAHFDFTCKVTTGMSSSSPASGTSLVCIDDALVLDVAV